MRSITSFVCQECGYESSQWLGKCPECGEWNSLREFKSQISNVKSQSYNAKTKTLETRENVKAKTLNEIKSSEMERLSTGFSEMDSVLGGGVVPGSVILLAGDPGVGKSTLLLQMALSLGRGHVGSFPSTPATPSFTVLYISGEESEEQIKLRSQRLVGERLGSSSDLLIISLTNTDAAVEVIQNIKPALVIVDSIQTMESENLSGLSGSIGQVRYAAFQFIKLAKTLSIPIILVGHVTKEGMVAGPMVLSHMVDTLLFLEGEKYTRTRILRSFKNRFGPVDEIGIFSLEEEGIRQIQNVENLFLSKDEDMSSGRVLVVTLEGTRAFLVEVQALVVLSRLPLPRRVSQGVDYRRLELLLAVLQKHARLPVYTMDVFVNVAGGLKLSDPAADLGICLAIFSSLKNIPLSQTVAISEVGLLGELRTVAMLDRRIKEAKKLGIKIIISPDKYKTLNEVVRSLQ